MYMVAGTGVAAAAGYSAPRRAFHGAGSQTTVPVQATITLAEAVPAGEAYIVSLPRLPIRLYLEMQPGPPGTTLRTAGADQVDTVAACIAPIRWFSQIVSSVGTRREVPDGDGMRATLAGVVAELAAR